MWGLREQATLLTTEMEAPFLSGWPGLLVPPCQGESHLCMAVVRTNGRSCRFTRATGVGVQDLHPEEYLNK